MAKDIMLLQLAAENFKGVKNGTYDFDAMTVDVFGANATGKTTLLDAYRYLFFGKDHADRSDFQRRPTDEDGKQVDNVEIMVSGRIRVDDEEIELKKVERQNWVKRHGDVEKTLAGNVTDYFINGFPAPQKQYKEKIESIIDEEPFKIKTDPRYFPSLKWQTQRQLLFQTEKEISDADILLMDPELFKPIRGDILAGGIDATRIKHNGILKKLKDLQASYPIRIDEVSKSIVEVDVPAMTEKKQNLEQQLSAIEAEKAGLIDNTSTIKNIQAEMMRTKIEADTLRHIRSAELNKARTEVYGELNAKHDEIDDFNRKLTNAQRDYKTLMNAIDSDTDALADETKRYKEIKSSEIPENDLVCPTCGRPFEDATAEERRDAFNRRKAEMLDRIIASGKMIRERLDQNKALVEGMEKGIDALNDAIAEADKAREEISERYNQMPTEPGMTQDAEYLALNDKLQELEKHLSSVETANEATDAYAERIRMVSNELEQVNAELSMVDANKRAEDRIRELQEEQRDNSQKVADEELVIYALDEFVKLKMNTLSDRINSKFKHVRFKLFEQLINGGLKETCVMMVRSNNSYVNYSDGNNAAQVQGGLDVIDALSELDGIHAPVWLDNRESVSEIPEVKSQVINLIVSPDDKELRIVKEG